MFNSVFLGKDGLTSTSANHVANLAKEYYQNIEKTMENINFLNIDIKLIGSNSFDRVNTGNSVEFINNLISNLKDISLAKSLIAWLREGIKAKESLRNFIGCLSLLDYCDYIGKKYPDTPRLEETLTEQEYYNSLPLETRARYYSLEAKAAVLGSFIHPGGEFSEARNNLFEAINNPTTYSLDGSNTLIKTSSPSIDVDVCDNIFFDIQKQYREIQAQLNKMKHDCTQAIRRDALQKQTDYSNQAEVYHANLQSLTDELSIFKLNKSEELENLKIVIPSSLKDIYLKINSLGKPD